MILVAGPYRSGTNDDPTLIARNVAAMTDVLAGEWREPRPGPALPRPGDGVTLRRLCTSDLAALQACCSDAELGRCQGWTAMPDAQARAFGDCRK